MYQNSFYFKKIGNFKHARGALKSPKINKLHQDFCDMGISYHTFFKPQEVTHSYKDCSPQTTIEDLLGYTKESRWRKDGGFGKETVYRKKKIFKDKNTNEIICETSKVVPWYKIPCLPKDNVKYYPVDNDSLFTFLVQMNLHLTNQEEMRFCFTSPTRNQWNPNASLSTLYTAARNISNLSAWGYFCHWAIQKKVTDLYPTKEPVIADFYVVDIDNHPKYKSFQDIESDFKQRKVPLPYSIIQTYHSNFHLLYRLSDVNKNDPLPSLLILCSKIAGLSKVPSEKDYRSSFHGTGIDPAFILQGYTRPKVRLPGFWNIKPYRDPYLVQWRNCEGATGVFVNNIQLDQLVLSPEEQKFHDWLSAKLDNELDWSVDDYSEDDEPQAVADPFGDPVSTKVMDETKEHEVVHLKEPDHPEVALTLALDKNKKSKQWMRYIKSLEKLLRKQGVASEANARNVAIYLSHNATWLKEGRCSILQDHMALSTGLTQSHCSVIIGRLLDLEILVKVTDHIWTHPAQNRSHLNRARVYAAGEALLQLFAECDANSAKRFNKLKDLPTIENKPLDTSPSYDVNKEYKDGESNDHILADVRHLIRDKKYTPMEAAKFITIKQSNRPRRKQRALKELVRICSRYHQVLQTLRAAATFRMSG